MNLPWDLFATAAVATPAIANLAFGFLFRGDGHKQPIARLFRWFDRITGHRAEMLAWLAITWGLLRGLIWLHYSGGASPAFAWGCTAAAALLGLLITYPVLLLTGPLFSLFSERSGLDLNRDLYLPGHEAFEEAWQAIRSEYDAFCALHLPVRLEAVLSDVNIERSSKETTHWRAVFLRIAHVEVAEHTRHFPTLRPLLERDDITNAMFSVLQPGVELLPHRGYFKGFVRYHLGVHVPAPEQTGLIVAGETYHWSEGVGIVFDDMFVHSAYNHSELPRVVLFLDVLRPLPRPFGFVLRAFRWYFRLNPTGAFLRRRAIAPLAADEA